MNSKYVGRLIRAQRKSFALRQAELAAMCGVGTRFVSDVENGKETVELGRVLRLLETLGLCVTIKARSWPDIESDELA